MNIQNLPINYGLKTVSPIRAQFDSRSACAKIGDLEVSAKGRAPVLALCRALIDEGVDPSAPLEAYRGETLCLKVGAIGSVYDLVVESRHDGKPVFRRRKRPSK